MDEAERKSERPEMTNERLEAVVKEAVVNEGFATVRGAGEFLFVGRSTIYQLMSSGELRTAKIGKCVRIPWASVKAFAQRSLVGAGS